MHHDNQTQNSDDLLAELRASCGKLLRSGKYEKALEQLLKNQHQLSINDKSGVYAALLGQTYFLLEQYDEAGRYYTTALEINPGQQEWQQMLALLKLKLNQH